MTERLASPDQTREIIQHMSYQIDIGGDNGSWALLKRLTAETNEQVEVDEIGQKMMFMPGFIVSKEIKKISVVKLTPQELGINHYVNGSILLSAARLFGLDNCPVETGPYACLKDLNGVDTYIIGMTPICMGEGGGSVLEVSRQGNRRVLKAVLAPLSGSRSYDPTTSVLFRVI